MRLLSRLATLWWFARRPSLYPQLWQLGRRLLHASKERTRPEATAWCQRIAIPKESVLRKLGFAPQIIHPAEDFPAVWAWAEQQAQHAPVQMGGPGAVDILYTIARTLQPAHILETGVAYGWSSLAFLLAIEKNQKGRLVSVDMPYPKMGNEPYVGIVVPPNLKSYWTLIRKPDVTGVPQALTLLGHSVQLFHYDSDKSYTGRMTTYPRVWKALAPGGIFISDDVGDNLAFKEFAEQVQAEPLVFHEGNKFVGVLQKPSHAYAINS